MTMTTNEITIPSNPEDRKKLNQAVRLLSDSKTRQESESEYQKETVKELAKDFDIKAKWINQMVKDYHKQQFDKKKSEHEEYSDLYEIIMQSVVVEPKDNDE